MGERALAACPVTEDFDRKEDTLFDCYAAQWAASHEALRDVFDSVDHQSGTDAPKMGHPATRLFDYDWQYRQCLGWSEIVETLDFLQYEAVYRISSAGVSVSLPVWLGASPEDSMDSSTGILVETDSLAEFELLRDRCRQLKRSLGEAFDTGAVRRETVQQVLVAELTARRWYRSN